MEEGWIVNHTKEGRVEEDSSGVGNNEFGVSREVRIELINHYSHFFIKIRYEKITKTFPKNFSI